jgi:hypothetical protein
MIRTFALLFSLAVLLPAILHGQEWTAEQQELVDHLHSVWDAIEANNEATYEIWRETVNPADDLVWWFTNQGVPYDHKALEKWHQWWGTRGGQYTYTNVRPIAVRIVDSVGMVWFWAFGEWIDRSLERHEWQDQRLEIFRKTDDGWEFLGGMVTPVTPFEGGSG